MEIIYDEFVEKIIEKGLKYMDDVSNVNNIFFWEFFEGDEIE